MIEPEKEMRQLLMRRVAGDGCLDRKLSLYVGDGYLYVLGETLR